MFSLMRNKKGQTSIPTLFLLLNSRLVFFLLFQVFVAFILNSWEQSEKYWLLTATLTNLISIALLVFLFRKEGKRYLDIFRYDKISLKKDLLIFSGIVIISIPLVFLPGFFLSKLIWHSQDIPAAMMFGPIDKWLVYFLLVTFPVTIAMAELATYFMYVMPRLTEKLKVKWLAVILPVLFLSLQHCTLPFIPDLNFIMYRALVFLPFAGLVGISIYYRPGLFVYFAIFHGFIDVGTGIMFLLEITN